MQTSSFMGAAAARRFVAVVVLLASFHPLVAQEGKPPAQKPDDPQLSLSPLKVLQSFEPAADEEYTIGPGDEVGLDFPGRAELSGTKAVGPDGRITLPLIGAVAIAGKTRKQAGEEIAGALSPFYKELTVTVNITKYGSNRVIVLGNVQHPGVLYFDTAPTLLDVVARAGLMASNEGSKDNLSPRDGIPERCAIYRGNDKVVWVQLKAMLQGGDAMADLRLRRNDIVFIPAQQEVFVSVLGSVQHPGAVPLTPQSTLTSVLAQSGGLAEGASHSIQIVQPSTGKQTTVDFKSLLTLAGTDEVTLHPGDIVYVPATGFYKMTYVIQRLSPVASIAALAAIAH
jgi:polysaccharide export outer membrane protein